jgi:hypothetical protein
MNSGRESRGYDDSMTSSHSDQAREYLQAVGAGEPFEKVFAFYAPDVVIQAR